MNALGSKVSRRGTVVLPAKLRRRLGIEEGSLVVAEEREDGILIRPAKVVPTEIYTLERRAEFLLNNAADAADYRQAQAEVKTHGSRPRSHRTPSVPQATVISTRLGPNLSRRQCFIFRNLFGMFEACSVDDAGRPPTTDVFLRHRGSPAQSRGRQARSFAPTKPARFGSCNRRRTPRRQTSSRRAA